MSTGYKAFKKGMICRDKQYKENTTYEENGNKICEAGVMHFCENPFDVLNFYPLIDENDNIPEFAEVEPLGEVYKVKDIDISATNKLHIGVKLGFKNFVKTCIDFIVKEARISIKENTAQTASSGDYAKIASNENNAHIASSGDYASIGSSGRNAQIASSGHFAQTASSGDYAQIANSGDNTKIISSGICSQITNSGRDTQIASNRTAVRIASSGDYARIVSSGNRSQIADSGDNTKIISSGNSVKIISSGDDVKITSKGKRSVVMAAGYNSMVKAKVGSFITLTEWELAYVEDEGDLCWIPKCIKTEYVDGKRIKEDTFYKLVNGEFVETVEAE